MARIAYVTAFWPPSDSAKYVLNDGKIYREPAEITLGSGETVDIAVRALCAATKSRRRLPGYSVTDAIRYLRGRMALLADLWHVQRARPAGSLWRPAGRGVAIECIATAIAQPQGRLSCRSRPRLSRSTRRG